MFHGTQSTRVPYQRFIVWTEQTETMELKRTILKHGMGNYKELIEEIVYRLLVLGLCSISLGTHGGVIHG